MSNAANFEDGVLLRLRRQYSQSEAVAFVSAKLSERDFEIGELKSEIEELKYLLRAENRADRIKIKADARVEALKNEIQALKSKLEIFDGFDRVGDILDHMHKLKMQNEKHKRDIRKDEVVIELKDRLKKQTVSRTKMQKDLNEWQNKYFAVDRENRLLKLKLAKIETV